MTEKTSFSPGEFCWTELATSDWKGAKQFYTSLFGWKADERPMGPNEPPYVMLQKGGKNVCALYENKKVRPNWKAYVAVASADEAAKKAKSLGAKLESDPFDVMDVGRTANVKDPQGSEFALWQAKRHKGAEVINEANTMGWNELYTTDIEGARKFYSSLFGWKLKISPGYTEAHIGSQAIGGMMQLTDEMQGMHKGWMPYFVVSDVDAMATKAKSLKGAVHVGPKDIPNTGRFAIFGDPQGAVFAVIRLSS
jgi:uncharacterized protein